MAVLAIVLLLFGGAGATAYAAQGALPGDALYSLKTGIEATQVRLSRDAARQAQLHLNFAERRLDEIASLIAEGRFDDIGTATNEFEAHVQQAINALDVVSAGDPQRAKALALNISSALSRYSQILRGMLTEVPETVKPVMERAILTSEEETGEIEFTGTIESVAPDGIQINGQFVKVTSFTEIKGTIAVGALVKVHALEDMDGALIAREIEVTASPEENTNDNANINTNEGASNANDNEAEDDFNDNQNANFNGNENEDDENENDDNANLNENGNHNQTGNQNMNENDDDHENDNAGSNQNDNEDRNENSDNENHNDNDDDHGGNDNDNGDHENDNDGGGGNDNHNDYDD
jgi:hypothetical protein